MESYLQSSQSPLKGLCSVWTKKHEFHVFFSDTTLICNALLHQVGPMSVTNNLYPKFSRIEWPFTWTISHWASLDQGSNI